MADSAAVTDHDQQVDIDVVQAWAVDALAPAITREELVDNLRSVFKEEVTERQLRSWVSYGVIPAPVRRAPDGGGRARALYPRWMLHVILGLMRAIAKGATIADLKTLSPNLIRRVQEEYISGSLFVRLDDEGVPVRLDTPRVPRGLQRALWLYADRYNSQINSIVQRITLTLHREDGREVEVPIDPLIGMEDDDIASTLFLTRDVHEG